MDKDLKTLLEQIITMLCYSQTHSLEVKKELLNKAANCGILFGEETKEDEKWDERREEK